MVVAQDVQAQIGGGQHAARAEEVAVVDEELVVQEVRSREEGAELVGEGPVGRQTTTVGHAGEPDHERAGAQRDDPGAAVRGGGDGGEGIGIPPAVRLVEPGDDDGVGADEAAPRLQVAHRHPDGPQPGVWTAAQVHVVR